MATTIIDTLDETMSICYPTTNWKEILSESNGATLLCPPCPDVLKWAREAFDVATERKQRRLAGQRAEVEFMQKFSALKMGGILVCGLKSHDLENKKTVKKKRERKLIEGECDAIFLHQTRGIFVIEVKSTTGKFEDGKQITEGANQQLNNNIRNLKMWFRKLFKLECSFTITGIICFPFRERCDTLDTAADYDIIDMITINDREKLQHFFRPRENMLLEHCSMIQPFAAELVSCRSEVVFHSQAYNAMQVAQWIQTQIYHKDQKENEFPLSSNGILRKIYLTNEQIEIVNSGEKHFTVLGPPGSGKTLVIMLRALHAAKNEERPGNIFIFVNEKLQAKYIQYFYEEKENISLNRIPHVHTYTSDKLRHATLEDDVFFDETPVDESIIKFLRNRSSNTRTAGSTTVVFTGFDKPGEVDRDFRLYKNSLTNFEHFALSRVLRGTKETFRQWERYFPHDIKMGHSINGVPTDELQLESIEKVQDELKKSILKLLTLTKISNPSELPSLNQQHIAVITSHAEEAKKIRRFLKNNHIACGPVTEQVRKSLTDQIIAVDYYKHTPSYEWPVVFVVMRSGAKEENVLAISASRCIAKLTIIEYESNAQRFDNETRKTHRNTNKNEAATQQSGRTSREEETVAIPSTTKRLRSEGWFNTTIMILILFFAAAFHSVRQSINATRETELLKRKKSSFRKRFIKNFVIFGYVALLLFMFMTKNHTDEFFTFKPLALASHLQLKLGLTLELETNQSSSESSKNISALSPILRPLQMSEIDRQFLSMESNMKSDLNVRLTELEANSRQRSILTVARKAFDIIVDTYYMMKMYWQFGALPQAAAVRQYFRLYNDPNNTIADIARSAAEFKQFQEISNSSRHSEEIFNETINKLKPEAVVCAILAGECEKFLHNVSSYLQKVRNEKVKSSLKAISEEVITAREMLLKNRETGFADLMYETVERFHVLGIRQRNIQKNEIFH